MSDAYVCARCREGVGGCMCDRPIFMLRPWYQWRATWWLVVLAAAVVGSVYLR